jgi:hypothetical protein
MTVSSVVKLSDIESYQSIKKNLENKKHSLQFLPVSLEEISKQKNFTYKGEKLKSAYIVDILHNLILKYYFRKNNKFSLMASILKEKYGYLYNYYMDFLIEKGVIILLSKHQKGKNSRIYAINEYILRGKIIRYNNCDKVLLKKYKNKISQIEENDVDDKKSLIDNDIKIKLVDDLFSVQVEFDRSIFYLDALKQDDTDVYNRNRYSVECINDKHIFYHFDNYGRMHTNFTILKSFIRKNCLLIDGEETSEIDIKNSQPLFLAKMIQDIGSKWVKEEEFQLFKELTISGNYYQYVMNSIGSSDRNNVKEMTYKVLFGRNGSNSKADKVFSNLFPTIHNFIKLYKKEHGDYRILAYDLQKAESNLIFNQIIRQIITLYPEIKVVTVHDSIIMQKKYRDCVWAIFQTKLLEEFRII